MSEDSVTITKSEYNQLVKDAKWLSCLEAAGVDNWDGYSFAYEIARNRGDLEGEDE